MAVASTGLGIQPYIPVKLPSSKKSHIKAMAVSSEAASAILPFPLCANPTLPLVATLASFKATLDSLFVVPKDKEQVADAGNNLAKWLATVAMLVDKSMLVVAALYNAIPYRERGTQIGPWKTLLFDITYGLAQIVLLTKLVELDQDVSPYLATLMVVTLAQTGEILVVSEGTQIITMTREAFEKMFLKEASHFYDNYKLVSS